jgi:hypothetical protein
MNAYAAWIVDQQIDELRRDAARRRLERAQRPAQPNMASRLGTVLASLRTAVSSTPAESANPVLPALEGYPYKS